MSTCHVKYCRFSTTHATCAHQCGICKQFGHGHLECGKQKKIDKLKSIFPADSVPPGSFSCDVPGCSAPSTHARQAHVCDICDVRGGCMCKVSLSAECPTCKQVSIVDCTMPIFTGAECIICYEPGPVVVFSGCRHANVCKSCADTLCLVSNVV